MKRQINEAAWHGGGSHRFLVWVTIGGVMLLAAMAATITAFATSKPAKITVSPTAIRPSAAGNLAKLRSPTPMAVTLPSDPFAGLTVTDTPAEHELEISIPDLPDVEFKPAFDVFEAKKADDWIVTPAGRVRLVAIGVADPGSVPEGNHNTAAVKYYHPADLTELPVEQLPMKQRMEKVYIQSEQFEPTYRFVFELDGFEQPDAIAYDVYDATTEARLCSGYSYSTGEKSAYVKIEMPLWHGPAIDLAMDLPTGRRSNTISRPGPASDGAMGRCTSRCCAGWTNTPAGHTATAQMTTNTTAGSPTVMMLRRVSNSTACSSAFCLAAMSAD